MTESFSVISTGPASIVVRITGGIAEHVARQYAAHVLLGGAFDFAPESYRAYRRRLELVRSGAVGIGT